VQELLACLRGLLQKLPFFPSSSSSSAFFPSPLPPLSSLSVVIVIFHQTRTHTFFPIAKKQAGNVRMLLKVLQKQRNIEACCRSGLKFSQL
jgi:hypothetical protein